MGRLLARTPRRQGATRGWRAAREPEETYEPMVDLLNRGVSVAGIAAREADGKTESPGNGAATA